LGVKEKEGSKQRVRREGVHQKNRKPKEKAMETVGNKSREHARKPSGRGISCSGLEKRRVNSDPRASARSTN